MEYQGDAFVRKPLHAPYGESIRGLRKSAQWQNTRRDGDKPDNHEYRRLIPLTATDPDSLVAATATAVQQLAQAIAASLPH